MAASLERSLQVLALGWPIQEVAYLVVYALVEEHAQRPPVDLARVALALVHLGREVCERARLARQRLVGSEVGCNVLCVLACEGTDGWGDEWMDQGRTKSARWTWPSESSSTLSGLMSLCTMPCWWM